MANRTKFTSERRETFLGVLAETGNVTRAAACVGMTRRQMYYHREADAEFAEAWEDAVEQATDELEEEARRRALEGVEEEVYFQGEVVGYKRVYSDAMMALMLKAYRSKRFRDRVDQRIEGNGPGGSLILQIGRPPEAEGQADG
jgi:hypothetical protein